MNRITWRDKNVYKDHLAELRQLNPYTLLGVEPTASLEEIKAAYRKKIRIYHPDVTNEFMRSFGEEVAKLLNSAYEVIRRERNREI